MQVGIDLVAVDHIQESLDRHGEHFLNRVYTPGERAASGGSAAQLAARLAAKEATMKALGRTDQGLGWQSIEVLGATDRGLSLRLTGGAAALAADRGVTGLSLTLTRQPRAAAAVVLAETAA